MDTSTHSFTTLFEQLGLAGDPASIDRFIEEHSPLPATVCLADAPFWNEGQQAFLHEALGDDSDWAELVDELDVLLR